MKRITLVLGSSSPRRKEIITQNIDLIKKELNIDEIDLEIISPTIDERFIDKNLIPSIENIDDYPIYISKYKMDNLLSYFDLNQISKEGKIIITCDTAIIFKNKIYGKPKDIKENIKYLNEFSSSSQKVISGYTIFYNGIFYSNKTTSIVTFNKLSNTIILNYLNSINTLDKAGGYSFQDDTSFHLIKKIHGSKLNIIGFPLEDIIDNIKKMFAN